MTNLADPVAQARDLVPHLAQHAQEAEEQRRPHDRVIEAMADARLFSLLTPRRCGGRRVSLTEYLETIATLGEGCVSSAWVCSFYAVHSWMLCLFGAPTQREVLRDGCVRAACLVAPKGGAIPGDGGYSVSGRWEFASGIAHADWVMCTALIRSSPDSPPEGARLFVMRREEVEVIDTWHVDGMAATASCDINVENVFVADQRSLDMALMAVGETPGAQLYSDDPLYRQPLPPLLAFVAAVPALGAARAGLRELTEQAKTRRRGWASGRQAQRAAVQMRLAEADMRVRCAELLLHSTARDIEDLSVTTPLLTRARLRMQSSWALSLCTEAVQSLAEISGAHAHQRSEPLQRRLRDLRMMRCHVIFEPDATAELYGRTLFGLDPETILV